MGDIIVKPATNEERSWAARLLSESEPWITLGITLEKCDQACHDPEYQIFTAHAEKVPCGIIILDPRGLAGSPYIKSIAVAGEFRSRQIGATLLAYAEKYYRQKSRFMFLCVSSFNTRARRFYESHGYARVGELKDYIVPGKSEIIMQKLI